MDKRIIWALILAIVTIVIASSSTLATDIKNIDFNISSEFKPIDDAEGLQFEDEINEIRLRIFDDEPKGSIDDMNSGFDKYNDTVYINNETMTIGDPQYSTITNHMFSYGEYIKIDGKLYWVEVSSDNMENPNYDMCLKHLEYFNEHNNFEFVNAK